MLLLNTVTIILLRMIFLYVSFSSKEVRLKHFYLARFLIQICFCLQQQVKNLLYVYCLSVFVFRSLTYFLSNGDRLRVRRCATDDFQILAVLRLKLIYCLFKAINLLLVVDPDNPAVMERRLVNLHLLALHLG